MEKYNTLLRRLLAAIIDGIILFPLSFIEAVYTDKGILQFAIGSFGVTGGYVFYFIILHVRYGQTIGKKITRVQVLDASEIRLITFKQSLIRESPLLLINFIVLLYVSFFVNTDISKAESTFYDATFIANFTWAIAELIYAISNNKRRAIHDALAGSVVAKLPK
jgi:uncharacterized RDD family membrane protein YckC